MKTFKHHIPTKVVFGRKTFLKIREEIQSLKLNTQSIAIVCGKSAIRNEYIDYIKKQLPIVEVFDGVPQDPSVETAKEFKKKIASVNPTLIIAIGGGSVLDLSKVVAGALTNEGEIEEFIGIPECFNNPTIPIVAVPTTSGSGSEVTPYAVLTNKVEWKKAPVISSYIFPVLSINDPELTISMPQHITANTGIDALTHCIEAFVSKRATSISKLYSMEGIKLIRKYLPKAYGNPKDIEAREKVMLGSLLGGMAITDAGAGLVHTLAHILGVIYDVPHGLAIAMFLVPVLKFYGLAAEKEIVEIGEVFGIKTENTETVLSEIETFLKFLGKPDNLSFFGVSEQNIGNFVSIAMAKRFLMGNLPKIPTEKDIRVIVKNLINSP